MTPDLETLLLNISLQGLTTTFHAATPPEEGVVCRVSDGELYSEVLAPHNRESTLNIYLQAACRYYFIALTQKENRIPNDNTEALYQNFFRDPPKKEEKPS